MKKRENDVAAQAFGQEAGARARSKLSKCEKRRKRKQRVSGKVICV